MSDRCAGIQEAAAGLAALAAGDPERDGAYAHAGACAACAVALREGEALGALLAGSTLLPPSQTALERARGSVEALLAQEDARRRPTLGAAVVAASALIVTGLLLALASAVDPSPAAWALAAALAAAALAAAAGAVVRARRAIGTALAGSALGALAAAALASAPDGPSPGLACLAAELGGALLPLAALALLVRRAAQPGAGAPLAAAGAAAAGALAAQAALALDCPVHTLAHLVATHVGGVVIAAALGMTVGRLLPVRRRPAAV